MNNLQQHSILFLATEYECGMRPYACTIIHSMWNDRSHAIVVIKDEKYKKDFADLDPARVHFIHYPTRKLKKLWFRFFPNQLIKSIFKLLKEFDIEVVYSLTGELVLNTSIKKIQKHAPLLYTVHDAIPHETKLPFFTLIKERLIVTWPQQALLKKTPIKITNSKAQLRFIEQNFSGSIVHYAPFPSLVNTDIANGKVLVPETKAISNYILFFGRIDAYKGVDLLYKCYCSHPELQNMDLVFVGPGNYYFPVTFTKNVVVINRFLDDNELANLFGKAAVVVYPYISATQSGVISIASFFKRPIVLSNVDYFKEVADGYPGTTFFKNGDIDDMAKAITKAATEKASSENLYSTLYHTDAMRKRLTSIIHKVAIVQQQSSDRLEIVSNSLCEKKD